MKVDEFVKIIEFIISCMIWFEKDIIILFFMCLVVKIVLVYFFVERIEYFEVEFVEIKKVRLMNMLIMFGCFYIVLLV